jgi:hypothetical protein
MTTLYNTLRGPDYDPVPVELWTYEGERLGKLGAFESMAFTTTGKPGRASTATLEVYLTELTAMLLPCDGAVLVAAHYNGLTLLYTPVTAEVHSLANDPSLAVLTVQCTGGWSFLEGAITTPGLTGNLTDTPNAKFELTGALETVIKTLIDAGQRRTGHPIVVLPSSGRGPRVTVTGAWETVGEHVANLLTDSGYMLTFDGWVPGDPQPIEGYTLTRPCYVVDLKPHTPRVGLVWSYIGGDLTKWSVTRKRASATRAVAHNGTDDLAERELLEVQGVEPPSPWAVREVYVRHTPSKDENMDPIRLHNELEAAAVDKLTELGTAIEVTASIETAAGWEYGTDKVTPRQYTVGDIATLDLPVLGELMQVVTDVEVKITPEAVTVTPTVGTPYTMDVTTYDALAGVDKRLTRLERKG